jgi:hypothetical protein
LRERPSKAGGSNDYARDYGGFGVVLAMSSSRISP